ncbi:uncharacterized protein JCM10292_004153 [Rhodotorula paludigena]|uniref:uncharacterized protein n=1 Tax=Rhodotorula paludigena TaxID=86838 RepID=UPI00317370ED
MRCTSALATLVASLLFAQTYAQSESAGVEGLDDLSLTLEDAGSLDTASLADAASSALGGVDTSSLAGVATSVWAEASGDVGSGSSAADSWLDGASIPTAAASLTSQYGGLISSVLANPAGAQSLISSALQNPDVSSVLAGNPQLSSLLAQATGLIGGGNGESSSNSNSNSEDNSPGDGAMGLRVATSAVVLIAGAVAGAVAVTL